ncbi:MAG: NAD(P)-dependent oxidoreductase [Desulfobacterales bacterium]|nr:MAG: NAD(P)-dependent oxidoreductase [Desulfobacterales bacterium]
MKYSPVLVLGATGYIGGRLVPQLLEEGWKVRAVGRSAEKIQARDWGDHANLEIVVADAEDTVSLVEAMRGCYAVFYLIHSNRPGESDFASLDRKLAYSVVHAAREAKMGWFIYFSGLGNFSHLSAQLRSQYEVGEILSLGGARVTELRAPLVLGSGGASFEMIRAYCGRHRTMLVPRWMDTRCQPIAVSNVITYLSACLDKGEAITGVYQIGGPESITWRELFQLYAEVAGLPPRRFLVLPMRIHRLSIAWMNLVTPVSVALIRPLIERMREEVVCDDNRIREQIPQELLSCRQAFARALDQVRRGDIASSCFDAGTTHTPDWVENKGSLGTRVFRDVFSIVLDGSPELVWNVVRRIGGSSGWYFGTFLWKIRGLVDKIIGGPGLARGRRHSDSLMVGDSLDFWRVVAVEEGTRLLLRAEMLAPGEAFLEFQLKVLADGTNELRMIPSFAAHGLWGRLYWLLIAPSHTLMFGSMLRQMVKTAGARVIRGPIREKQDRQREP